MVLEISGYSLSLVRSLWFLGLGESLHVPWYFRTLPPVDVPSFF